MPSGFLHGVYTSEQATSLVSPVRVDSAVVFAVGTAAVHKAEKAYVNVPRLYYSYDEFVQEMGWDADNFADFSLQQLAYSHFALYGVSPLVCVNVFDPDKHKSEVTNEQVAFSTSLLDKDTASLAHGGVAQVTVSSEQDGGGTVYVEGDDYTLDAVSGTLVRSEDGDIAEGGTVYVSYVYADVAKVTSDDVIGGVEAETGKSTGFELVNEVYPRFGLVPSILLSPKFCEDPSVAIIMAAKCDGINDLFKAICVVDVPTSGENAVTKYTDVTSYKNSHNLTDELMMVCWPKVMFNEQEYSLSTHMAGAIAKNDSDHGGIPYASPSNKRLEITSCGYMDEDGVWQEVWLDLVKGNYLNGQGICTVSNFNGGMKSWGGRMACYPSNTDPKDCQDAIRRFFNWYQATFILTYFIKVDEPMTKRLIQTILKSEQNVLDGYTSREIILGGTISFDEADNPTTDLMDGIMRFRTRITPPPAARDIEDTFEFDTDNLSTLFSS